VPRQLRRVAVTKLIAVLGQPCAKARPAGRLAARRQQIVHKPLDFLFGKDHVSDSEPDHLQPTQDGPWRQPDHRGPAADRRRIRWTNSSKR
jgi:hypothetical protein